MTQTVSSRHLLERRNAESEGRYFVGLDPRMHHALTDLHAYALALDAEWRRSRRDGESRTGSGTPARKSPDDLKGELDALRETIAALAACLGEATI